MESLARVLDELEGARWAGMVLTGKPFVFAAGADLDEFPKIRDAPEAVAASRRVQELFARVSALPFPTLAAINGVCLGGGVEIALHCELRTISSAVRHFGCPEVSLGIVPGWGGTQLAPRLAGIQAAITLIVENPLRQNRLLDGRQAHELGFANELLEPAEFLDDSLAYLTSHIRTGARHRVESVTMDPQELEDSIHRARSHVDDQVHGAAPAPYRALDLIAGAARWSMAEGYDAEAEATGELLPSRQARASLYAFDLVERRAKAAARKPAAEPRRVAKVGVVGAGLMATQVAALFLRRLEVPVVLRDLDDETVQGGVAQVRGEIERLVERGRYDEGKGRFLASLVTGSTEYDVFAGCDIVLEAVFEELQVKQEVFEAVEGLVAAESVLATNTSALSVTEMASVLDHPERVVGMHFFNPVAVLPLVELVRARQTNEVSLATAWQVATALRKRPVLVRDSPGFVVNRILTRMLVSLLDAVERGNTVEETDEAMLRLGLPMAPSVLLQLVGPRVANHVLETLHAAYPSRFALSATLAAYAEGREEVAAREPERRTVEEIQRDTVEALADEIRHLLEEGVVGDAGDVDTALILGAGWPFFLGGITKYLDQAGISERVTGMPLEAVRPSERQEKLTGRR